MALQLWPLQLATLKTDDRKAKSILILSLSDETAIAVLDDNLTAKMVWDTLTTKLNPASALNR